MISSSDLAFGNVYPEEIVEYQASGRGLGNDSERGRLWSSGQWSSGGRASRNRGISNGQQSSLGVMPNGMVEERT
jgi:hypothetical protein